MESVVLNRWYPVSGIPRKFQQGKVFYCKEIDKTIFYRDFTDTEIIRFCNGLAMDETVLKWLKGEGVRQIHLYWREKQTLLKATVAKFFSKGIARPWQEK